MTASLNEWSKDLFDGPVYATVASIEPDGSPQLSVVWVERDGDDVLFSTLGGRRKAQNWTRDPRAALIAFDPEAQESYVEVRGTVTLVDDPGGSLIHKLANKYTGTDFAGGTDDRVIVRLTPDKVITH